MSVQELDVQSAEDFIKAQREERRPQVVGPNGETHGEFEDAFDLIKNPEHWKLPIITKIPVEKFGICALACSYFTGSELKLLAWLGEDEETALVEADGYYVACPEV